MGNQASKLFHCFSDSSVDERPLESVSDGHYVTIKPKHGTQERPRRIIQKIIVNYPSPDVWYACGKTRFPDNKHFKKIIKHQLTIDDFEGILGVKKRNGLRMIQDDSAEVMPRKCVNIINFDGVKSTEPLKTGVSKESIEWFEMFMDRYDIDIQHFCNTGTEKTIRLYNNKFTSVDGWCEKFNMVFEYHGSFFHGDPDEYSRGEMNRLSKTTYEDLYVRTRNRDLDLLISGYSLCTVWAYKKKRTVTFFIIR